VTTTTRTAHIDSWASEARPGDTHGPDRALFLKQAAGGRMWAYVFCTRPWAASAGVTVISAKLRVWLAKANAGGAMTVRAQRIEASWQEKQLAWKQRPATVGVDDASAVIAAGAAVGTMVEFDVTAALQLIADGAPYFGFRLAPDAAAAAGPVQLASSEAANPDRRPVLVVDWSSPPDPPTDLRPSGGRRVSTNTPTLSWTFGDVLDPSAFQSAYQVQIDDADDFAAAEFDTGQVASGVSQLQLAATAYAGLPADASVRYWRVRVWDESGEASDWSDPVTVRYVALGVVDITAPGATTQDVRPLVTWTFAPPGVPAGVVQEAWRAFIERLDGNRWVVLADSGLVTGTDLSWSPPVGLTDLAASYRARVQIADSIMREAIVGAPALAEDVQPFTYAPGGGVTDPTGLAAAVVDGYAVALTWDRATRPDHWLLEADGYVVADDIDVDPVGTAYGWTWYGALPRHATVLRLHAVELIGGAFVLSPGAVVNVTTDPEGIWLVDAPTGDQVHIAGREALGAVIGESSAVFTRIAEQAPVVVTEIVRGYEGSASGVLVAWDGQDPRAAKDLLLALRERVDLRLVLGDLNLPVSVWDIVANPTPNVDDERFDVALSFVQRAEFDR
jgi:hypothetical protein